MPRSSLDFSMLQRIRYSALSSLNSGSHRFDVRTRYACGYVAQTILKYLRTDDESCLQVKYAAKPLSFNKAVEHVKDDLNQRAAKKVKTLENSSMPMVKMMLENMGNGSTAMVAANYDPNKPQGRMFGGLIRKIWGHWFNMVVIGGKVYAIDAYSKETFSESHFSEEYLEQYQVDCVDAIMVPVDKRQGMLFE